MVMLFAGFTSAYIVRQSAGNWLEFQLPQLFYFNTGVILLSSLTLQGAYRAFMRQKETLYKGLLVTTLILGIVFLVLQYQGWTQLMEIGVGLGVNPSGDFIYVISGTHAAHVVGGIGALLVAIGHAFGLKFRVTERRKLRLEMTLIYWHFVDFLWLYLIGFFLLQG
ncbi:MAG: cytochrome oxidase subunit III [Bacteroidetes bacterium]|nr:MAG: cytochrome oxidase subunit III [Bacteroidota bacterium]